jgi:hypothetical protein
LLALKLLLVPAFLAVIFHRANGPGFVVAMLRATKAMVTRLEARPHG